MARLEKMIINGIRSFGPEEEDKQTIQFFSPLTLILGPNGTGKTTIIECLKYITSGDFPPNTKGAGFVHDPNISNENEIKGQVKLLVKDFENRSLAIFRSLLATKKGHNINMKTLDSSISVKLPDNEWSTISAKCADIDKEVVQCLGVSKAILNNVIFCHQEDSCWPLAENKSVKDKFDDIFAASRYIKALDSIKKIRAAQLTDVKVLKSEVSHYKIHKDTRGKKSDQLLEKESRFAAVKEKIDNIVKEVKPLADKLDFLSAKEGEVNKLKEKLSNQETLLKQLEKNKANYLENIQELFEGSVDELQEEMYNFSKTVGTKKRQLEDARNFKKRCENDCNSIRNRKETATGKLAELKTLEKQNEEKILDRENLIRTYALEHGITGHDQDEVVTEEVVESFVMKLACKIEQVENSRDEVKKNYEDKENEFNKKIEDFNSEKARQDQTIKMSLDRKKQNEREIKSITDKLHKVDNSVMKQKELELSLSQLEAKKVSLESSLDTKALKAEVAEKQKIKEVFELQLQTINQEMNKLQLESQSRTELDMLMKDMNSKEDQIKKLTFRHEETVIDLLGSMPEKDAVGQLEVLANKFHQELRSSHKELSEFKSKLSALETRRQYQTQEIKQKENFIRTNRERIFEVAGGGDFNEILKQLQETIEELQDEKGVLAGSQVVDKKYIERIEKTFHRACCPLCERGFQDISEAQDLVSRLKRKILMIPEQIEAQDRQISEKQNKMKMMLELRPIYEELKNVSENELPELKNKLDSFNAQISDLENNIKETEKNMDSTQLKTKTVSSMQPDMVLLKQYQNEFDKVDQKVRVLKEKFDTQSGDVRTIQDVSNEREDLQIKMQSVSKFIKDSQEKLAAFNEEIHLLNEEINAERTELLNIQSDQQKRISLEEQKCKLLMEITQAESDVKECQTQIESLKSQLALVREEKQNIIKQKNAEVAEFNVDIKNMSKSNENIEQHTKNIKTYRDKGYPEKQEKIKNTLEQFEQQLLEKEKDAQEKAKEIEEFQKDLANQELKEREMQDNLKLKECDVQIANLTKQCEEMRAKLGDIDTTNLFKDKTELQQKHSSLTLEKQSHDGRIRELGSQIKDLKKELNDHPLKNAHEIYKQKYIELKTTEMACEDLNKYYKALDNAVMDYHSVKMTEINKIIREIWRKTYKGNDIDYIEICTDKSTSTGTRQTYHYRVVMVNKDIKIDMRGRCSAGQRVLASLIIRLALAETFCFNCGILALDEPTTNLDRENISSLANSLADIVRTRCKQKNFQLVVITHDVDFIELLGRDTEAPYFYKISKDQNCFSQIEKCNFSQIENH